MKKETTIKQKNDGGSNVTQIAVQNNTGLTVEEATRIATSLFKENFPSLVEDAKKTVQERLDLFLETLMKQFASNGKKSFEEFANPDVQVALLEAQIGYARSGDENDLRLLTNLVVKRVQEDKNHKGKIIIDEAIKIIPKLSKENLDYLANIFFSKMIKIGFINDLSSFRDFYERVSILFPINDKAIAMIPFLNMLGCFQIGLGEAVDYFSKAYVFLDRNDINKALPSQFNFIPADYTLSPSSAIIAIIHINARMNLNIDYEKWI